MRPDRLRFREERAGYATPATAKRPRMKQRPNARALHESRGNYAASRGAYLFFCVAVAFAVALLTITSFILPPRALPTAELRKAEIPVAAIQLSPDRNGLCRHLLFHNDTGRYEEAGTGRCHSLIPAHLLIETVRGRRADALGKVFKLR